MTNKTAKTDKTMAREGSSDSGVFVGALEWREIHFYIN